MDDQARAIELVNTMLENNPAVLARGKAFQCSFFTNRLNGDMLVAFTEVAGYEMPELTKTMDH